MTVMPVPQQIPVQLEAVSADLLRIVTMVISVRMTPVIQLPGVKTPIILIPVTTVMPALPQIPVQLVLAWADLLRTVMMAISVQPIAVMPLPGVKTSIIPIPVMTGMPVLQRIPAQPVPA
jgi:hypothetical protein